MSSKPTPGPWKRSGANTVHGPDCIVCFVGTADEEIRELSGERQGADATIIAAAPDLLAACRGALKAFEDLGIDATEPVHLLRAAIKKARGEK